MTVIDEIKLRVSIQAIKESLDALPEMNDGSKNDELLEYIIDADRRMTLLLRHIEETVK